MVGVTPTGEGCVETVAVVLPVLVEEVNVVSGLSALIGSLHVLGTKVVLGTGSGIVGTVLDLLEEVIADGQRLHFVQLSG